MIDIMGHDFIKYGTIVNYTSIQFEESMNEPGHLEIHVNASIEGAEELQKGRLVIIDGDLNKCGLITDLGKDDEDQDMIIVKGHELKIITRQRTTIPPEGADYTVYNGTVEWVMRKVMLDHFIQPEDPARLFPFLQLGIFKDAGPKTRVQQTNKPVNEVLTEISKIHDIGWRITPDLEAVQYLFQVFSGTDRSDEVLFEDEYGIDNILSASYTDTMEDYKNVAYVYGEGEGAVRKRVLIGNATGWNRHELTIDARDLQSEEEELTEAQYLSILQSRGYERLAEHQMQEFLSIKTLANTEGAPFQYGRDFYLGDIVMIQLNRWGLAKKDRVTSVLHVWEDIGYRQDIMFGAEKPNVIKKIKRTETRLNVLENSKVRAQVSIL
ncbi:siphovirus ReqiPepy6 Gp37-like family protein [Jeotgalibacillus haloalkalitolerans]|uniref:Siphovirus ReqiPepy6 Gp37-like family protein n=1 Tax=Jeotgalibacillus haloalkalitolerans TaxID=3104292 RepID=A0ABU5KK97_9BACL|nr:siphovirus ReqiPepy6 Gp37-like family protein [Jeotgalibacillus sp. HH7-29]MDZ5711668.1 siphovirus ReqiPepy6 Gp37-like family protein [Jeotgalibacillus sp. HH7-29]